MIRVACPKCGKPLGLPDAVAGKPVKCPSCHQPFIAPGGTGPVPTPAAPAYSDTDDLTPYHFAEVAENKEHRHQAQIQAVDEMVVTARRQKKRNSAWEFVGLPAKFIKRAALTCVVFWLLIYLFLTMIIVLANHTLEQEAKGVRPVGFAGQGKDPIQYLFLTSMTGGWLRPERLPPMTFWLIITGGFTAAMIIYGLQIAGAEAMRRLEHYGLAMFSMIVGTLSLNLFGIWGLVVLMNHDVRYEFRVSARRMQGLSGEEIYAEGDEDEEDEQQEEEDSEDEEEAEEQEQPTRRRR